MTEREIIKEFEKEIKYVKENEKYDYFNPIVDIDLCEDVLNIMKLQNEKIKEFDEKLIIQRGLIDYQKAEIERLEKETKDKERAYNDEFCLRKEWQTKCQELLEEKQTAKSEAIKGVIKKIDELLERYSAIHNSAEIAMQDVIECDNETIEMQSVWDVHTLIANEIGSEPEEMNRLQDNIETIAKERLLKEIEKDFRLLVKEMTDVEVNQKKEDENNG